MNEKSPDSRGDGDGSSVVVAAVLTVVVVLFAALLVGGVFFVYFVVPIRNVGRPASPNAVTTVSNAVTTVPYEPVETLEGTGEGGIGKPLATDVDSTTATIDGVPEEGPKEGKVESVVESPGDTIPTEAKPVSKPPDMTPPADETVEDATMPPAGKESPESRDYQSLPRAFERVGVKTDDKDAGRTVAFSGRKCTSAIWAQPDEDEGVSQVSYRLGGKFATLRGTAGIIDVSDDAQPDDEKPSVVFRIYGDGNLLWESNPQTDFGAAQKFEVEVKGIDILALAAESTSSSEASPLAWGDVELKAIEE